MIISSKWCCIVDTHTLLCRLQWYIVSVETSWKLNKIWLIVSVMFRNLVLIYNWPIKKEFSLKKYYKDFHQFWVWDIHCFLLIHFNGFEFNDLTSTRCTVICISWKGSKIVFNCLNQNSYFETESKVVLCQQSS